MLATVELTASALLRGCESCAGGHLIVSISMVKNCSARLIVADDIAIAGLTRIAEEQGAPGELAELLEGSLLYPDYRWAETAAEIEFAARP